MNCGGVCTDTANDRLHCGNCATACAAGQICSGSVCTFSCPSGQVACGGRCIDQPGGTLACATLFDLGSIGPSGSTSSPTRLQPTPTTDWYVVRFPDSIDFSTHEVGTPRILFSQNDGPGGAFRFDIRTSCGGAGTILCQTEGIASTGLLDWQFFDGCGSMPNCTVRSASTPWPTTVFIGVRRVSTAPMDCSEYRLQVTR